ncbi:MAG TPA: TetR family transcriptional regulator C-terminal domain-containing protein [Candidatus Limnocylindrales bacterium]|nr:TetR family transcriptional regulator C-terminal domain-containing protein [Candidatus Limnocylindrales bacterium]
MPRKVDHDERRRHIVEALLRIAGNRGLDAVSLREVAQEAGVSMGAVQHYFSTKEEMLGFALGHWLTLSVHEHFTARVRRRLGEGDPRPRPRSREVLLALAAEYLPHDAASRFDARVALAFLSRAAYDPALARALTPAFESFTATLRAVLATARPNGDPAVEARRLAALLDGLRMPVLVGALPYKEALAVVEDHLDRLLPPPA